MALGKKEYEIVKEGQEDVLKINAESWPFVPSVEDNNIVMAYVIDRLVEMPSVSRIVFTQRRNYIYDFSQVQLLLEIANIYKILIKQKKALSITSLGFKEELLGYFSSKYMLLQDLIFNLMRNDPIGAYVELKRLIRGEKITQKRMPLDLSEYEQRFLNLLESIYGLLDKTKLINLDRENLAGLKLGDRSLYSIIFRPTITPDFMFTRLMIQPPLNGEELEIYSVENTDIVIFSTPEDIKPLYHMSPTEFKISEDKYELLDLARTVMAEHKPREEEFLEPERMRVTFFNIGRDLIQELAEHRSVNLNIEELNELTNILVRYTVGFGLIELLLQDQKVQDIVVNGPIGQTPIFLVHEDYNECVTNIIPSREDAESWASKFRILSGRPLDEANPVLDTELIIPGARARIAIIQKPLNPYGLGFALRRHRDNPWTLALFTQNKMINSLAAGLLSFLIDGSRSILFAGTRSSGKTSLLGAALVEIMRKYRIISIEDSVTGDSELLIKRNGKFERTTIGYLIDSLIERYGCWYNLTEHEVLGNDENIEILAMDKNGKIKLTGISKFIRHKVKKPIYKILTRTGREIKVTGDHSLFGLSHEGKISEVKAKELKKGGFIATPRSLPFFCKELKELNILDYLDRFEKAYVYGGDVKNFLKNHYYEVQQLGKEYGHNRSLRAKWVREGIVPVKILRDMKVLGHNIKEINDAYFKIGGHSKGIPIKIKLNENLLTLIGLWLADGCYDKVSTIISSISEEERGIIYSVANELSLPVKMHSDGISLMINSITFKTFLLEVLELKGNAYTKRIPNWAISLTNEQLKYIIRGLFSGDGHAAEKEIMLALSSINMLRDIQTLLLRFGIIHRIGKLRKDKTYNSSISSNASIKIFQKIGFLQNTKKEKLAKLAAKISTHDNSDIIPLFFETKKELRKIIPNFNYRDYVIRDNNIGRNKMIQLTKQLSISNSLIKNIEILANSDLYWDEIKEIKVIKNFNSYVYDISVPECESFIADNIVAHNTLELPTEALRELGYNIQAMKVRSALTKGGVEVPADEGIRTSLRMGDSSLIVGEIRSLEAYALYEAMRIGALANVVAGTIHGDSPYGVFDRVVNDLKVPKTSFKATDIIVISNPVRSADGLHKWRRVLSITEVRKGWEEDPLKEKGFVDLMKYDPEKDELVPTDDLINGDSDILKNIAGNVKEWTGNWDALWSNILLRAKIKQTIVDFANKNKMNQILEAPFIIASNDAFHRIADKVSEDIGGLDSNTIFSEWELWFKKEVKLAGTLK